MATPLSYRAYIQKCTTKYKTLSNGKIAKLNLLEEKQKTINLRPINLFLVFVYCIMYIPNTYIILE